MDQETAAIVIQYRFRKWFYRNAECCISFEKVKFPCFIYQPKGSDVCIFYDYIYLKRYFDTSGKYIDPKTRNEYTPSEIERFYSQLEKYFPGEKIKVEEKFPGIFGESIPPEEFDRNAVFFNALRIMNGMNGLAFT